MMKRIEKRHILFAAITFVVVALVLSYGFFDALLQKASIAWVLFEYDKSEQVGSNQLTHKLQTILPELKQYSDIEALQKYTEITSHNSINIVPWPNISVTLGNATDDATTFVTYMDEAPMLPTGKQLVDAAGKQGKIKNTEVSLTYLGGHKKNDISQETLDASEDRVTYVGTKAQSEVSDKIQESFNKLLNAIHNKDQRGYEAEALKESENDFEKIRAISDIDYRVTSSNIQEIIYNEESPKAEKGYVIGHAVLIQKDCGASPAIDLVYNSQSITFAGITKALTDLCSDKSKFRGTLTCTDCKYAPVDNQTPLASTYVPNVVPSDLLGGGYVTPETKDALHELFDAAQKQGITISVKWGYRSYALQKSLFDDYVNGLMKQGMSHDDAVQKTKQRVAPPGESEHQLGTTIDVQCGACDSSNQVYKNSEIYMFLNRNAQNFGFVVSYPNNCQQYTGIIYEPWHIRFVGKDIATDLFNKKYLSCPGGLYAGKYLRSLGRF